MPPESPVSPISECARGALWAFSVQFLEPPGRLRQNYQPWILCLVNIQRMFKRVSNGGCTTRCRGKLQQNVTLDGRRRRIDVKDHISKISDPGLITGYPVTPGTRTVFAGIEIYCLSQAVAAVGCHGSWKRNPRELHIHDGSGISVVRAAMLSLRCLTTSLVVITAHTMLMDASKLNTSSKMNTTTSSLSSNDHRVISGVEPPGCQ